MLDVALVRAVVVCVSVSGGVSVSGNDICQWLWYMLVLVVYVSVSGSVSVSVSGIC